MSSNHLSIRLKDIPNHHSSEKKNRNGKRRSPKKRDENGNIIHAKPGPKPGTVHSDINKDGTPRKKPDPKVGSKKGLYNKDGSLRKKPGPKPKQA